MKYITTEQLTNLLLPSYNGNVKNAKQASSNKLRNYTSGKSSRYAHIQDPENRRSRLIEIDSLPSELKARVKALLSISDEAQSEAYSLIDIVNPSQTVKEISKQMNKNIKITLPYISSKVGSLSARPNDIATIQDEYKVNFQTAHRWALMRVLADWYQKESSKLDIEESKTLSTLVVRAISNDGQLSDRFPRVSHSLLNTIPTNLIVPKNASNNNASKGCDNKKVQDWLIAFYAQGNRPKISQIFHSYNKIREKNNFPSITLQTMYNWVAPIKGMAGIIREGENNFSMNNTISVNREYPEKSNVVWSMDGTAYNGWVINRKGKISQGMYKLIVMDVATGYTQAKAGQTETTTLYQDAFKRMVAKTGYLPQSIETDHFSGWKVFKTWLEYYGVNLHVIAKGNARAKIAERIIGLQSDFIERFEKNFSGMNLTAKDGKLSQEFMKVAIDERLTWEDATYQIEEYAISIWNNRELTQWNRKPCGLSPNAMRTQYASATDKLTSELTYRVCGTAHDIKLTIDGLVIREKGLEYIYFPEISTDEVSKWADFFTSQKGNVFCIYTLGSEAPALVCDGTDKIVGYWNRKETIPYNPIMMKKGDGERLQKLLSLRKTQISNAKSQVKEAKDAFPELDAQSYAKINQFTGHKPTQQEVESLIKMGDSYIDTLTGEVIETLKQNTNSKITYTHPVTGQIIKK